MKIKSITLLTDYKGYFGYKWKATPIYSGYNLELLKQYFNKYGYAPEFIRLADVNFSQADWHNKLIHYTSSQDYGDNYKGYIEDIIYGLELNGAHVVPGYKYLRAHNNKVFMEILRDQILGYEFSGLQSQHFGTLEEIEKSANNNLIQYPCIIKSAMGAMSSGVALARDLSDLIRKAKQLSRTPHLHYELRDWTYTWRYDGYQRESRFQKKFIIQNFIPGLANDWKVLIYGDQFYVLKRHVRPNDFRASGSHVDYYSGIEAGFPEQMLEFAAEVYRKLDVPQLSIDVGFDGSRGYVFEFQALNFGASTQYISNEYFTRERNWTTKKKAFDQEEAYVWALVHYFERHTELFK
jgi:glutathione synthase/RimK-type ligase-like ATP-grasp enzyme